ncbi:MAG: hypothetical protein M1839_005706 [Geoglossum umbratile]|nr:MAG: hypothetical protein M1839_005706 [Geoglossum umbratile]
MLTGVETAGLVLAVLPLFISALEHYNDGLEPIKAFWDIDHQLPIQIRRLRNQHVHFEQTLRILLAQLVEADEVEEMIAAPNSGIWKTVEIQERLERRLQESYNAYQDTVNHMEEIMKRIAKDFRIDHSERANRSNLEALLKTNTREDGAFEFKRRIKFAMSGKRMKSLLDDLDECNKELERFTDKSERLVPYRKETKFPAATSLNQVRTYAKSLYSVLCIGTNCHVCHQVKLRLERRIKSRKGKRYPAPKTGDDVATQPCFTVSFLIYNDRLAPDSNSSWIWQDAQIQVITRKVTSTGMPKVPPKPGKKAVGFNLPLEHPPQTLAPVIEQNNLQELKDLCSTIKHAQSARPCLGFCLDNEGRLRGIYPVEKLMRSTKGTTTLKELLAASPTSTPQMPKLSRKERMTLAVIISSSYLQLQATPWLKDTWSKEDIVFDEDMDTTSIRPLNVDQPYIVHGFQPRASPLTATQNTPSNVNRASLPGNPSLLALGIILLELYTGQTFEQCCSKTSAEISPCLDDYYKQLHNLDAASKWLNAAQEDLSAGYMGAVLHCFRSFFDPINTGQNETVFRQSIYEQVILPLHEELQSFLGESQRA